MCIEIIKPGLASTFQDFGRYGYQDKGISVSGAMDQVALKMANMLVNNPLDKTVLEMTVTGDTILFHEECIIAITGADMGFKLNGRPMTMNKTTYVCRGMTLTASFAKHGLRAYMAIRGGFKIKKILGSGSTFVRGSFGGHQGRKLMAGDKIEVNYKGDIINYAQIPNELLEEVYMGNTIRMTFGNEKKCFTKQGVETFLNGSYTIGNDSDRMGYRLSGDHIEHVNSSDIISGGINFGSIQVPGSGQPIIMMADRQTTGGYTKMGQVIQMDLPKLAQKKPQEQISFQAISVQASIALWKAFNEKLDRWYDDQEFEPRKVEEGLCFDHYLYDQIFEVAVKEVEYAR